MGRLARSWCQGKSPSSPSSGSSPSLAGRWRGTRATGRGQVTNSKTHCRPGLLSFSKRLLFVSISSKNRFCHYSRHMIFLQSHMYTSAHKFRCFQYFSQIMIEPSPTQAVASEITSFIPFSPVHGSGQQVIKKWSPISPELVPKESLWCHQMIPMLPKVFTKQSPSDKIIFFRAEPLPEGNRGKCFCAQIYLIYFIVWTWKYIHFYNELLYGIHSSIKRRCILFLCFERSPFQENIWSYWSRLNFKPF